MGRSGTKPSLLKFKVFIHPFLIGDVSDQLEPDSLEDTQSDCPCKPSNILTRSPSYSRLPPHVNIAERASFPRVDGCQPSKQKDGAPCCSSLDDGRSALDCFFMFNQSIHDPKVPRIHLIQSSRRGTKPNENLDTREPSPRPCPRTAEHPCHAGHIRISRCLNMGSTWGDAEAPKSAGYEWNGLKRDFR